MPRAIVTTRGRVTLPVAIRQALELNAGDRLEFVLEAGGRVVLRPATPGLADIKGCLSRPRRKPVELGQMESAIIRRGRSRS